MACKNIAWDGVQKAEASNYELPDKAAQSEKFEKSKEGIEEAEGVIMRELRRQPF
jgi:hypothetical protein